ncbi:rod linker polypeptide (Lr)/ C-phycoerythrin class I-associated (CpeE) [Synechococcus sp. PROS-9-1]|uniref:phycobilisome rod-core linker polypeptide n=1 Tax=Synechococcus sp. PROS-9-1 TaxID=1968775 RepID=UPI00164967D8|nr:phycobilisome rod-core linker polypeptide [Synechococcus sp. PROS-9-1]QNJ30945.1 rod linker polypeptide (Lr)/ C-phycoerythrin class I-associated (CpeE) [Synechococcus sp. PROS-9-1]
MSQPLTLATKANVDLDHSRDVIKRIYRQVFGNRHLMELDVNTSLEALFINGDLTVQGFVTALAQSETYKKLFLERNSPYKFVELNFKHLLGRAPHGQSEIMEHVKLLSDEGYETEIASYTYSAEYLTAFGIDQVPYSRGSNTMQGGSTINYARTNAFEVGYAGYDGAQKGSTLLKSITTGSVPDISQRKGVGNGGALTISWSSRKQIGANRRVAQKSVVSQTSMSSTIKSILSQGGKILSITKA